MNEDREAIFLKEREEIKDWRPPDAHTVLFKRRVLELEMWIERKNRFVHEEEIVAHAMRRFNVEREQARKYLLAVVKDFERAGVRVLKL